MENENTIEYVAELMAGLRHTSEGTMSLLATEGHLAITNPQDVPKYARVLFLLTPRMISSGLTSREWNKVQNILLQEIQMRGLR